MRLFVTILTLICLLALPIRASSELWSPEDFDADLILEPIPDDVRELLPRGEIFDSDFAVERFDVAYFARVGLKLVASALEPALESFAFLMGLVLLSSALGSLRGVGTLGKAYGYICSLAIMCAFFGRMEGLVARVSVWLETLTGVVTAMVPVLGGIAVAGGNVTSAVVSSNAMLIGLAVVENLAAGGLMPILRLTAGLSLASGLGGDLKLSGLARQARAAYSWMLGLCAAAISAVMSFQTTIASRADSLSMRAVRFAASSAIPVAGGIAADAVGAVATSLSLIRSTVGWVGVVILLLLALPILLEVLLTRFGVNLAATAADVLGLEREKSLLEELSGLLGSLCAVVVIVSLMFLYALAVFAVGSAALAG